jgi:hypothetical protein
MTEENIKRMALESGFSDGEVDYIQSIIIHFATLVAQQEREACADLCKEMYLSGDMDTGLAEEAIRARGQA